MKQNIETEVTILGWKTASLKLFSRNMTGPPPLLSAALLYMSITFFRKILIVWSFPALAHSKVDDVRSVLEYYMQFDDPMAKFRENQLILQVNWLNSILFLCFSLIGIFTWSNYFIAKVNENYTWYLKSAKNCKTQPHEQDSEEKKKFKIFEFWNLNPG